MCACPTHDRYDCIAARYGFPADFTANDIDNHGGPCECPCHDEWEDDEDDSV